MANAGDCVGKREVELYLTPTFASPGIVGQPAYAILCIGTVYYAIRSAYMHACSYPEAIGKPFA